MPPGPDGEILVILFNLSKELILIISNHQSSQPPRGAALAVTQA
jgi:hypothetical protein